MEMKIQCFQQHRLVDSIKVLSDALFKLAGELALEALQKQEIYFRDEN